MDEASIEPARPQPVNAPTSGAIGSAGRACGCGQRGACGCGGAEPEAVATPGHVYALGRIEPRFPRPSVERELAQAIGRAETPNLTDRQAMRTVLSQRANRYLVRELCWVLAKGLTDALNC